MSDQMNENEPRLPISRRTFLKAALTTGAALALNGIVSKIENTGRSVMQSRTEARSETDPAVLLNTFALRSFNPDEKESAEYSILKYKTSYKASSTFKERVERINKEYKPLIKNAFNKVALNSGESIYIEWLLIMPGLIMAESSADPNPDGDDIGLCQLTDPAIKDAKALLHQDDEYIDPQVPQNNITLALAYLLFLHKSFPTADMAIWAYNLGSGNLTKGMEEYIVELYGEDQRQNIENALNDPRRGPAAFLYKGSPVNVYQLLESRKVADKMNGLTRGEFAKEEVREYFYKVIGAAQAYLEVERTLISQTID